jgi:tetratricopeptide (TPR) repeat protein
VEPIGEESVYHVDENTCIGLRNLALHLWRNLGLFGAACDLLGNLASSLFSPYKSDINAIWEQALAEIKFEYFMHRNNWKEALAAVAIIRRSTVREADLRVAQLRLKQGNSTVAFQLVNQLLDKNTDHSPYFKVRALLTKTQILPNSLTLLMECIDLSRRHHFLGLHNKCLIELSDHLLKLGQPSQALRVLRKAMVQILSNGTCFDVGRAHHLHAKNLLKVWQLLQNGIGTNNGNISMSNSNISSRSQRLAKSEQKSDHLKLALESNARAIEKFHCLGDRDLLREALQLQAVLYHEKGEPILRNYWAHQVRNLVCPNDARRETR